ncbi:MAG: hypothetical protein JXA95_01720 [Spirochaetales bacterium]|nr:hypothetical protein [Spirochaetales bacterium]
MKRPLILLIIAALLLTGCVTYYNSSDVNKYFDSGVSQADKAVNDAEKDFAEKTEIIAGIRENISDPAMVPYPSFDGQLAAMGTALDAMKEQAAVLKESRELIKGILKGKKTIQSDEAGYRDVIDEKDRFETLFEDYRGKADRYQKESAAFNDLAKQHSLVRVVTADLEKKVQDYKKDSDNQIANAHTEIDGAEVNLDSAEKAGYDELKIDEKRLLLLEMRLLLADIEEKRDDVLVLAKRFRAEAGERSEYYVGPGMASFELLKAIKEASADISAKSKEMNGLAERFGE